MPMREVEFASVVAFKGVRKVPSISFLSLLWTLKRRCRGGVDAVDLFGGACRTHGFEFPNLVKLYSSVFTDNESVAAVVAPVKE